MLDIDIQIETGDFVSWLQRSMSDLEASSRQALGQSVALALRHAQGTSAFKDRTGALRKSLSRGQKGPWAHFLKAGAKHAVFVEHDTKPHIIEAKRRNTLRFVQAGQVRFARRVRHPGTKGTHFVQRASEVGEVALMQLLEKAVERAFR